MKKLITILLVLVMLVSILVLPAMASEIQPRYPVMKCTCGGTARAVYSGGVIDHYECGSCGAIYYP